MVFKKKIKKIIKYNFLKGVTRNVVILGLVSLFTDISSQMVFPLIPLFLISVLGAGAYAVGIVEGAAETTASILKVVSGFWSDKIKRRKPFVLFGYSLSTITKPLFALAGVWSFVLFVRVIERIGKGIRDAPRDAIVAESVSRDVRGKAYGFQRSMDGFGSIIGAVLAFFLLPILGYRNIFLFAFIPGVLAVLIILFLKEKKVLVKEKVKSMSLEVSFKKLSWNLRLFIIVSAIFAMGQYGYAFLLLRAKDIGLSDHISILLYIIFYVAYVLFAIPSGIISDKVGRKPVLIMGYFIFVLTSIGLVFVTGISSLLVFFILYGLFFSIVDGVQRAFVVDLAPNHLKATALGTFHTAIGLVALPGGFIAGLLWDKISPQTTFLYGLSLSIVALILFMFVKNNVPIKKLSKVL